MRRGNNMTVRALRAVPLGCLMMAIIMGSELLAALRLYRLAASTARFGLRVSHSFSSTFVFQLAFIEAKMGRLNEAAELLNEVLRQEPNNASCYLELGLVHERMGEKELAAANFARSFELGADFGEEFRAALKTKIRELGQALP
jgi:tetratricopeptide (TPR) repeat protein